MTMQQATTAASLAKQFQASVEYYLSQGDTVTALDRFLESEKYRAQLVAFLATEQDKADILDLLA